MWDVTSGSMIIDLKYRDGNTKNCDKTEFKKDCSGAQFYYIDKFILVANQAELLLYKHHVERPEPKISKRVIGRYQRVSMGTLPSVVTCMSACNSFFSTLVMCGLADKSLGVYDFNKECLAVQIPDIHPRAPHTVAVMDGSKWVQHNSDTHNLVLTAGVSDTCKLWDIRSGQCVRGFSRQCRVATTPSVSTCVRYVAVPGDDQAVHVFDIRQTGTAAHRISSDGALVTQFSTKYPQIAVGSSEGVVTFYNDR
eukprot:sb/3468675/